MSASSTEEILCAIIILVIFAIYSYSTKDYREKKKLVEKDEQEYGEDYAVFKKDVYKESPERIVIKKENTTNEFYIFDKNHEEYEHLLKVILDKMYFVSNQDFNLWAFTPYSINDISNSNENFIVFDYNEDFTQEEYMYDLDFNRDIFFRYSSNSRLYRLVDFLTYKAKKYKIDELRNAIGKEEFVPLDQIVSGYKYMNPYTSGD